MAIRVAAVHLGGLKAIEPGERRLELRFSDDGLAIFSTVNGALIGRLGWDEILALELPPPRRGRRLAGLRKGDSPRLVVQADRGQASFELTGLTTEQVTEHLAPMLARARGSRSPD